MIGDETYLFGPHKNSPDLATLAMALFLPGLEQLSRWRDDYREIAIRWDHDASEFFEDAVGLQVFTGASNWPSTAGLIWTLARVHAIGDDGYLYTSVCFATDPAPHWFVGHELPTRTLRPFCKVRRC